MKRLFTLLILFIIVANGWALVEIDGINYWLYTNNKASVTVKEYFGDVVIPSTVTYNGKEYVVTKIEDYAFEGCTELTSISIPNTVTFIDRKAFMGCDKLTSINIPSSITSIEDYTFSGCSLTSVTLPNSVTSIGKEAFRYCDFTSVNIPSFVTSIGEEAFYGTDLTSVTIPSSVSSIGDKAFDWCWDLESVTNLSRTPQPITSSTFYISYKSILYVPKGTKETYEAAEHWKEFNIIEIGTDAIEDIHTAGLATPIATYTLDGKRCTSNTNGMRIIRYSDGTIKRVK